MPGISEKRNTLPLKLISWNVNGLRAVIKKDFETSLRTLDADIVAIQETKLQAPPVRPEAVSRPHLLSRLSAGLNGSSVAEGIKGIYVLSADDTVDEAAQADGQRRIEHGSPGEESMG